MVVTIILLALCYLFLGWAFTLWFVHKYVPAGYLSKPWELIMYHLGWVFFVIILLIIHVPGWITSAFRAMHLGKLDSAVRRFYGLDG